METKELNERFKNIESRIEDLEMKNKKLVEIIKKYAKQKDVIDALNKIE